MPRLCKTSPNSFPFPFPLDKGGLRGIKQNLKIKTFLGTSKNAVLTQIWTAMVYYQLLAYIKYQTQYKHSLLHLTRIIKECLFKRADIIDLLNLSLKKVQRLRDPCYE